MRVSKSNLVIMRQIFTKQKQIIELIKNIISIIDAIDDRKLKKKSRK